jgi:hypothetical protein
LLPHRTSDLSVHEGVDFQELNAHLVNSRTNESIANCKAYMCHADCKLEHFDAYEDLAAIAARLVQVALPKQESPEAYVCCVLFIVLLCRMTVLQVRDVLATVFLQPDDEAPSRGAHAAATALPIRQRNIFRAR